MNLLKIVGFSATPADGMEDIRKNVDYVCSLKGGYGAFRECSNLILKSKFPKKTEWY